jgi:D-alanyl-D-alanine carboxypeptidase
MKRIYSLIIIVFLVSPLPVSALTMSELLSAPGGMVAGVSDYSLSAYSSVVMNQITGEVLASQNASASWVPASLSKLVTALVVLDTHPDFNTKCVVNADDEVGGARLYAIANSKYRLGDLMSATLVASANNAANAMADCTGLTRTEFVTKMNEKAIALGAKNTHFVDPSGISEFATTTALDMANIANAAFSTERVREIARQQTVWFCSASDANKCHTLTNTNKLFGDPALEVIAGKTGYLDESRYNFAASSKNAKGQYLITVVLGNPTKEDSFSNTKTIASLGFNKLATQLVASR